MPREVAFAITDVTQPGDYLAVRPMNFGQACDGRDVHSYAVTVGVATAIEILAAEYVEIRNDTLEHRDADEPWEKDLEAFSDLQAFVSGSVDPRGFFELMAHELLLRLELATEGEPRFVANTIESVTLEGGEIVILGRAYPWAGS